MRVPRHVAVLALLVAGALGGAVGASLAADGDRPAPPSTTSTTTPPPLPTTTGSTTASRAAKSFATCEADQLEAGLGGTDGAGGTVLWTIVIANRGASCSLEGWPHLTFLARNGREIPIDAQPILDRDRRPVDLFGTDLPFVVNGAPLVEAAKFQIHTATDRKEAPDMATYTIDRIDLRLPGVVGMITVPVDGMVLASSVGVTSFFGPSGTVSD